MAALDHGTWNFIRIFADVGGPLPIIRAAK
jgi:hypothetical protein